MNNKKTTQITNLEDIWPRHLLTPWSTVLLEKLTGSQQVKKSDKSGKKSSYSDGTDGIGYAAGV
jgi:hypothetical protein